MSADKKIQEGHKCLPLKAGLGPEAHQAAARAGVHVQGTGPAATVLRLR
jgi:hypothetical protein